MGRGLQIAAVFLLVVCSAAFWLNRIGFPEGSLHGVSDLGGWEYSGFYLYEHLRFVPWPSMDFLNDELLYPYGMENLFFSWAFERDGFYALMRSLFGQGPWLEVYFGLSQLILCFGAFILLRTGYPVLLAACMACMIPFLNAYAINKFPHHLGIGVYHWSALGVICDWMARRAFLAQGYLSLRWILTRVMLTFLCFGQELGYIAGISLTSFCVCYGWMATELILRDRLWHVNLAWGKVKAWGIQTAKEVRQTPGQHVLLAGLASVAGFLTLPLLFQLKSRIDLVTGAEMHFGTMHTDLGRIYWPLLDHVYWVAQGFFKDSPEGVGGGSPGLFLLLLALLGLFTGWRWQGQWRLAVPFLLLFTLFWAYHPTDFPTLKVFPWFSFARVGPRFTIIYSTLLVLFASLTPWRVLWQSWSRLSLGQPAKWLAPAACLLLVSLGVGEQSFSYRMSHQFGQPSSPSPQFLQLMDKIRASKGEAALDWPFCLRGGNIYGTCPHEPLSAVYAHRKYHGKDVVGGYIGKLTQEQAGIYIPSGVHILNEQQKDRCLTQSEREHLLEYFLDHDFAGMVVYEGFLPKGCRKEFLQTWQQHAQPVFQGPIPGFGQVTYLQKREESQDLVGRFQTEAFEWRLMDYLPSLYAWVNEQGSAATLDLDAGAALSVARLPRFYPERMQKLTRPSALLASRSAETGETMSQAGDAAGPLPTLEVDDISEALQRTPAGGKHYLLTDRDPGRFQGLCDRSVLRFLSFHLLECSKNPGVSLNAASLVQAKTTDAEHAAKTADSGGLTVEPRDLLASLRTNTSQFWKRHLGLSSRQPKYKIEDEAIFMHPFAQPATFEVEAFELGKDGGVLVFGGMLKHHVGEVMLRVFVDDELAFSYHFQGLVTVRDIRVPLKPRDTSPGSSHRLRFEVDAHGTTNSDWFWLLQPRWYPSRIDLALR